MKNAAFSRLAVQILLCLCFNGTIAQSISGVVNTYHRVTAINAGTSSLSLSSAAGLVPGTKVLIIQMQGAVINNTNTASFGDVTDIGQAGNYEYNYICSVAGNDVLLKHELAKSYNTLGSVQLIAVPQYNIVTVADTLKADPWNSSTGTGGIVVLEADTLYLNSAISVSGQGFAGGAFVNFTTPTYNCSWAYNVTNYFLPLAPTPDQYYSGGSKGEGISAFITNAEYARGKQANGGGGGNNHNTGGAGGANYGAGGDGGRRSNESFFLCHGTNPGIGGLTISSFGYTAANNRIFMGGGGGASHQNNAKGMPGGNGGGVVIVTANVLVGTGTAILANGLSPVNLTNIDPYTAEGDGGGGGGGGGSIILNVNQVIGNIDARVRGARGSDASRGVSDCTGPGGGGGGGVVWMSGPAFSPNISADVAGGTNGVISAFSTSPCVGQANGATSGGNGSALTDYTPPTPGNVLCVALPVPELKSFKGRTEETGILLVWTMISIDNIRGYEVQRSIDQVSYSTIAFVGNDGSYQFTIHDKDNLSGTFFYRLKFTRINGTISYSTIIPITKKLNTSFGQLNIYPNPATHQIKVSALIKKNIITRLAIFNASGQRIFHREYNLPAGYATLPVPVDQLSPGVYWLMLEAGETRERKKFIRGN